MRVRGSVRGTSRDGKGGGRSCAFEEVSVFPRRSEGGHGSVRGSPPRWGDTAHASVYGEDETSPARGERRQTGGPRWQEAVTAEIPEEKRGWHKRETCGGGRRIHGEGEAGLLLEERRGYGPIRRGNGGMASLSVEWGAWWQPVGGGAGPFWRESGTCPPWRK